MCQILLKYVKRITVREDITVFRCTFKFDNFYFNNHIEANQVNFSPFSRFELHIPCVHLGTVWPVNFKIMTVKQWMRVYSQVPDILRVVQSPIQALSRQCWNPGRDDRHDQHQQLVPQPRSVGRRPTGIQTREVPRRKTQRTKTRLPFVLFLPVQRCNYIWDTEKTT